MRREGQPEGVGVTLWNRSEKRGYKVFSLCARHHADEFTGVLYGNRRDRSHFIDEAIEVPRG